jgi:hypothetical protein
MKTIITYKTRELGYGSEEGQAIGYLTDEVDTWGKRLVLVKRGSRYVEWYLFPDEYVIDGGGA